MLPLQFDFAPSKSMTYQGTKPDIEAEKAPDIAGPTTALDIVKVHVIIASSGLSYARFCIVPPCPVSL